MELRIATKGCKENIFTDLLKDGWFNTDITHLGIIDDGEGVQFMCPGLESGRVSITMDIWAFWRMVDYVNEAVRQLDGMNGQRWLDTGKPWRDKLNEDWVEQEIQEKGLNAPRLRPADIENKVIEEDYHVFPGTTTTVCCLTLENGATVIGESACVSEANFNAELGRKIARENAKSKIWQLEGYLLKQRLSEGE